ncbi:MAG: type II toxin-antitoxin system Phd/YefM family antitoxin [Telmatospirillum sp.]|nr:type II toxin-antitoxin system Phd/YefM family antitoxin [Telmatospirillum sp.]
MQRFPSQDLQRNSGVLQEAALREPVVITHHGRDRLVLMSFQEYERLKQRDRQDGAFEHRLAEVASLDHLPGGNPGEGAPSPQEWPGKRG